MDHHNKDDPKNKGDNLMLTVTGLPKDLDEYIDFSMIAQAEGLKFGIEHFRRRKPQDRKSTRLNSSHANISYAVFCLKKKNNKSLSPPRSSHITRCDRQ